MNNKNTINTLSEIDLEKVKEELEIYAGLTNLRKYFKFTYPVLTRELFPEYFLL